MMLVVMVVASVVRTVSGEAGSGQGEGGEDRHEDFLVVVRFITSSLSARVGLTLREATRKAIPDTENKNNLQGARSEAPHGRPAASARATNAASEKIRITVQKIPS